MRVLSRIGLSKLVLMGVLMGALTGLTACGVISDPIAPKDQPHHAAEK